MTPNWTRTVAPTSVVLTLAEIKAQAKRTDDDENGLLAAYGRTADETAEEYLGYGLLTQTNKLTGVDWPERIWLPRARVLQSVTSVEYYDESGTLQTLASSQYIADDTTSPASIVRAVNAVWPQLQAGREAWRWRVTYVLGWSSAASVPERIKQGLRMFVTHLDEDRSGSEADSALALAAAHEKWSDRIFCPPYRYEAA